MGLFLWLYVVIQSDSVTVDSMKDHWCLSALFSWPCWKT